MLGIINTSASGMIAQRQRMDVIAGNIANSQTTIEEGKPNPYQRRVVEFIAKSANDKSGQVSVGTRVRVDHNTGIRLQPDPVDPSKMVQYPDINLMAEFADAISASRAFEANVSAMQMTRQMAEQTLQLLQR